MPSEFLVDEYRVRINRVIDYIVGHCVEDLTLDDLAKVAWFSKFHFLRIFRAMTGETVYDFIRRMRLQKAAHLLVFDRRRSITDIGLSCGFSSSQNFAKAFKLYFHVSASHYRAQRDFRDPSFYQSNPGNMLSNSGNRNGNCGEEVAAGGGYFCQQTRACNTQPVKRGADMNVQVKDMAQMRVAYFRAIGKYGPETVGPAFQKLMQWAGARGLLAQEPAIIGVSWDNPDITPEEKCRYDACIAVGEDFRVDGGASVQTIPGGICAVYHCEVVNGDFNGRWMELMRDWLPSSGYQPDDRPCYERYYNEDGNQPGKAWICDLVLPVKPL